MTAEEEEEAEEEEAVEKEEDRKRPPRAAERSEKDGGLKSGDTDTGREGDARESRLPDRRRKVINSGEGGGARREGRERAGERDRVRAASLFRSESLAAACKRSRLK